MNMHVYPPIGNNKGCPWVFFPIKNSLKSYIFLDIFKLNLLSVTKFLSLISYHFLYSGFIPADFIDLNSFISISQEKALMWSKFLTETYSLRSVGKAEYIKERTFIVGQRDIYRRKRLKTG